MDKTVYVKADARSRYEVVVEIVNVLRATGVDTLGLLTDKIQDSSDAAPVVAM
jgi:biopolymer transport protein ExbD/biopolymer transport protein TolR